MFKIGEKIVCIDPSISLVRNEIYTIFNIKSDGGLMLHEVEPITIDCNGFKPERFRKIDYDFAENVLAKLIEEVKEQELIKLN